MDHGHNNVLSVHGSFQIPTKAVKEETKSPTNRNPYKEQSTDKQQERISHQFIHPTLLMSSSSSSNKYYLIVVVYGISTILKILVGFDHHSGQDNYHGSRNAYGGDYEAQRHWMELTLNLPIGEWYYYDLQYWGLDYPPLTAYVSWVCGYFGSHILGPASMELDTSRGIEDPIHKAYMRLTVLILDLFVFGTAIYYAGMMRQTRPTKEEGNKNQKKNWWLLFMVLCQPANLLIDHGHFQYNTVALGLSIYSFAFICQDRDGFVPSCIIGSIFFCLALNFKQMTLYYAPAIFCYLLGRCFQGKSNFFLQRFGTLGLTVIITFALLWGPFLLYKDPNQQSSNIDVVKHILHRVFPFERGLFEGKVSNLWCVLDVKPINIRDRLPASIQPIMALMLTCTMISPSCYKMFRLGRRGYVNNQTAKNNKNNENDDWNQLLWATTSCSLGFFLASFQVHEKSILLALAPCSLLLWEDPLFVDWFSIACIWTLWPLLKVDRLQVSYACMIIIYMCIIWIRRTQPQQDEVKPSAASSLPWNLLLVKIPILVSLTGMVGLHLMEIMVEIPLHLPDLFEVLWSIGGCAMFCYAWLVTCWKLLSAQGGGSNSTSHSSKTKTE